MKQFKTAARRKERKAADEDENLTEFEIVEESEEPDEDDNVVLCRAYQPIDGQLAMLLATTGRFATTDQQVAGLINFFIAVCDEETAQYIGERLLDGQDEFGLEDVQEIMDGLVEEWGGHPTQQPSGSAGRQRTTGRKSTRRTPVSTS